MALWFWDVMACSLFAFYGHSDGKLKYLTGQNLILSLVNFVFIHWDWSPVHIHKMA